MATSHIPAEILQQFSSYFQVDLDGGTRENSEKSSTLAAMCLASKSCQRVAEQYLYRTVIVKAGSQMYYDRKTNIVRLLNTLLTRPRQASEVREIFVTGFKVSAAPQMQCVSYDLAEDAQDYLHDALYCSQLSMSLQHVLHKAAFKGIEDGLLSILLLLCINVEHLDIPIVDGFRNTRLLSFVRECTANAFQVHTELPTFWSRPFPLSKLRYLGMHLEESLDSRENWNDDLLHNRVHESYQHQNTRNDLGDILRLPLITSLRARGTLDVLLGWRPERTRNSNVKKLHLELLNYVSLKEIEKALGKFSNLVDLRLVGGTLENPTSIGFQPYRALGEILRAFGTRLQNLDIKMMYTGDTCQEIGDLRGLTALRTLSCFPTAFVQQHDPPWQHDFTPFVMALPRSLQRLEIAQCDNPEITSRIEGLRGLLETQVEQLLDDEQFGKLTEVRIQSQHISVSCVESWEDWSAGDWVVRRKIKD